MHLLRAAALALGVSLAACTPASTPARSAPPPAGGRSAATTPAPVDLAIARQRALTPRFTWSAYGKEAFARAAAEGKLVLIDGAASWCHWCHVMDETTYLDPAVGSLLAERFVTVRFDADAEPDLAERYGEWGWPATIILGADAHEIGKFRGYLPPAELLEQLQVALAAPARPTADETGPGDRPGRPEELPWIAAAALHQLDAYWDPEEGGWGRRQKAPIGEAIEVELRRAERGDARARSRVQLTIDKQRQLIDPVWGGVYQYSAAGHWRAPHFEKLATYQASNLSALARAARLTARPEVLADAQAIRGYVERFLSAPDGAFYTSQDADLGGHDRSARFVDGHVFFPLGDQERRALGVPRVDTATHPYENGLLLAAWVSLFEATSDPAVLERARRAALALRRRVDERGSVLRDAGGRRVRFSSDAAATAWALTRMEAVAPDAAQRAAAVRVAEAMLEDFAGGPGGALFASTPDPDATGVLARRTVSLATNALAARALAELARVTGDARWAEAGRRLLAGAATPRALEEQGRMVGGVVLAAFDLGVLEP